MLNRKPKSFLADLWQDVLTDIVIPVSFGLAAIIVVGTGFHVVKTIISAISLVV